MEWETAGVSRWQNESHRKSSRFRRARIVTSQPTRLMKVPRIRSSIYRGDLRQPQSRRVLRKLLVAALLTSAVGLLFAVPGGGASSVSVSQANVAQTSIAVNDGDVAGLIAAIQTLNSGGGGSILLAPNGHYNVIQPPDWWYGPNAFPAIASTISIDGQGATISRP